MAGSFEDFCSRYETNPGLQQALNRKPLDWQGFQEAFQGACPTASEADTLEAFRQYRLLNTMHKHMSNQLIDLGARGWYISQFN